MPTDANPFELDLNALYERYLVTCRMSGVEPAPRDRAGELLSEWDQVFTLGLAPKDNPQWLGPR